MQNLWARSFFERSPYLSVAVPTQVFSPSSPLGIAQPCLTKDAFFENGHDPVQGWAMPNMLHPKTDMLPTGIGYAHTDTYTSSEVSV